MDGHSSAQIRPGQMCPPSDKDVVAPPDAAVRNLAALRPDASAELRFSCGRVPWCQRVSSRGVSRNVNYLRPKVSRFSSEGPGVLRCASLQWAFFARGQMIL